MSQTATLSFTTEASIKKQAKQKIEAEGLKFHPFVRSIFNQMLSNFIKTGKVGDTYVLRITEEPSMYFKKSLNKAREDLKKGKASPLFKNAKDSFDWLDA